MESDTWTGYFEEKITEAIQYGRETISRFLFFKLGMLKKLRTHQVHNFKIYFIVKTFLTHFTTVLINTRMVPCKKVH